MGYFPQWTVRTEGVVASEERLPWRQTVAMGAQHVVAMFGATVLAPLLMGFDPNVAILMSGVGTLIFFLVVGGRVPSYLGSSFAFIGVVIAATGYAGSGPNPNLGTALGGIIACGAMYTLIGVVVMASRTRWIEKLMPPIVTGAVVAVIGCGFKNHPVITISGSWDACGMCVEECPRGILGVRGKKVEVVDGKLPECSMCKLCGGHVWRLASGTKLPYP